jgi:NDP-sugar pyrophosphorylase family protein
MAYIDYGLGVMQASVLDGYPPAQPFDLADVYQALSLQGQLAGMEVFERFYEIGSHTGLKQTEDYFFTKERA